LSVPQHNKDEKKSAMRPLGRAKKRKNTETQKKSLAFPKKVLPLPYE